MEIYDVLFHNLTYFRSSYYVVYRVCLENAENMEPTVKNTLYSEFVPFAIEKTHMSKQVSERVAGCYLLGAAIVDMDIQVVKRDILPVVQSLCQDHIADVRSAICTQLSVIYSVVATEESSHLLILPCLIELANDTDDKVCAAAWETVLNMIPSLHDGVVDSFIVPMLKNFFKRCFVTGSEVLLATLSNDIGKMFSLLEKRISLSDKRLFLSDYKAISRLSTIFEFENDSKQNEWITFSCEFTEYCRHKCSFNFATIANCCIEDDDPEITEMLYTILISLSNDRISLIRSIIALNYDVIVEIFIQLKKSVLDIFFTLLTDADESVYSKCILHLGKVLSYYANEMTFENNEIETARAIKSINNAAENVALRNNWRLTCSIMEQIQNVCKYFPSSLLYSYIVDPLFRHLKNLRQVPCRLAAAVTLLVIMNKDPDESRKNEIANRIIHELCLSSSFYHRTIYVQLCLKVIEIVHCSLIREQFLNHLLCLTDDNVSNIRISISIIIPKIVCILNNDKDENTKNIVQKIIAALENEKNKSVLEHVKLMQIKLSEMNQLDTSKIQDDIKSLTINDNSAVVKDTNNNTTYHNGPSISSFSDLINDLALDPENNDKVQDPDVSINNQSNDSWSEKEFLIDTGVQMEITNSKISASNNHKEFYNQIRNDSLPKVKMKKKSNVNSIFQCKRNKKNEMNHLKDDHHRNIATISKKQFKECCNSPISTTEAGGENLPGRGSTIKVEQIIVEGSHSNLSNSSINGQIGINHENNDNFSKEMNNNNNGSSISSSGNNNSSIISCNSNNNNNNNNIRDVDISGKRINKLDNKRNLSNSCQEFKHVNERCDTSLFSKNRSYSIANKTVKKPSICRKPVIAHGISDLQTNKPNEGKSLSCDDNSLSKSPKVEVNNVVQNNDELPFRRQKNTNYLQRNSQYRRSLPLQTNVPKCSSHYNNRCKSPPNYYSDSMKKRYSDRASLSYNNKQLKDCRYAAEYSCNKGTPALTSVSRPKSLLMQSQNRSTKAISTNTVTTVNATTASINSSKCVSSDSLRSEDGKTASRLPVRHWRR